MSAAIRALSPGLTAVASAIVNTSGVEDKVTARRQACLQAIQGVSSVPSLIELIPFDYRGVLADPIHELCKKCILLHSTRSTLAKWQQCLADSTLPPNLKGLPPKIQWTTAFTDSYDARRAKDTMDAAHSTFTAFALTAQIRGKSDEVAFLER